MLNMKKLYAVANVVAPQKNRRELQRLVISMLTDKRYINTLSNNSAFLGEVSLKNKDMLSELYDSALISYMYGDLNESLEGNQELVMNALVVSFDVIVNTLHNSGVENLDNLLEFEHAFHKHGIALGEVLYEQSIKTSVFEVSKKLSKYIESEVIPNNYKLVMFRNFEDCENVDSAYIAFRNAVNKVIELSGEVEQEAKTNQEENQKKLVKKTN